jgi:glycosyltransferase involved in cell wall biosynthesis
VTRIVKAKLILRVYGVRQLYWQWDNFWLRLKECRDYAAFLVPADYFIITNDGTHGDLVAKRMGVADSKIRFWRSGINEQLYKVENGAREEISRQLDIGPSSKIILSTSRLNDEYGVDRLFAALPDVLARNQERVCLVAGGGPREKMLKEFTKRHNISEKVIFLGIVDRAMIKKILYAADIFVLLSRYHSCTNTLWEAMACGKCIVTTDNEAVREVLTDGKNACLIPRERLSEVPDILNDLLENDNLRNALGQQALVRSREILEPWPARIKKEKELLEALAS